MDELDLVDEVELLEQHGADQAIEIAAGDQAVLAVFHCRASLKLGFTAGCFFILVKIASISSALQAREIIGSSKAQTRLFDVH
jgi:hypothetical protein